MKLTELSFERYGAIFERRLIIPQQAGLTLIYGANEAGKSTALEAIGDFLFGIPRITARGHIFGYNSMRISAKLMDADGETHQLTRAKRTNNSLTLADGSKGDRILSALLGNMTRDRYQQFFGLDHESLRAGGDDMLAADGEIGRIIVEAGGGLRNLMGRLEELDRKAADLFDMRRAANRLFYQQLDRFTEADRAAKAASLTQEAYQQAQKAVEAAAGQLAQHRGEQRQLKAQSAKWERIARVLPVVRAWDQRHGELAEYADVAEYPALFAADIRAAVEQSRAAQQQSYAATQRRDLLKARMDALWVDEALDQAMPEIAALAARALHVGKAREDRANRLQEMEQGEAKLSQLRQLLGLAADVDLQPFLPDQAALNRLRGLVEESLSLKPKWQNITKNMADLKAEVTRLDDRIKDAKAAGWHQPPQARAEIFDGLAGQQAAQEARRQALASAREKWVQNLAQLGFGDAAALMGFACPSEDDLRGEINAIDALENAIADQAKAQRAAERRIADANHLATELQHAGPVASDASVAEARQHRGQLWGVIKQAYIAGKMPENLEERLGQADDLNAAMHSADQLADRRASEAERAAHMAQAQRSLAEGQAEAASAAAELNALEKRKEQRRTTWRANFPNLAARTPDLAAALHLVQARQSALVEAQRLEEMAVDLAEREALLTPQIEQLHRLEALYTLPPESSFSVRVSAVQQAIRLREARHGDYGRATQEWQDKSAALQSLQAEHLMLQQAQDDWQAAWPDAATALGLTADISPQMALEAVTEWSGALGILHSLAQTKQRLIRMDEDGASLAVDMRALAQRLGRNSGEDGVAAANILQEEAAENAARKNQRLALAPEWEEAKVALVQALEGQSQAQEKLGLLSQQAGLSADDEAALLAAASRHDARADLLRDLAELQEKARLLADQQDWESLRAECEHCDLDAVRAEVDDLLARAETLEKDIEASILAEKEARDILAQYASQDHANLAIAQREAAAAEMHLALERYLELSLAREMVSQAMAKIRAEQQSPLILRAGELFAAMTVSEFSGIDADVDDVGQPVVVGLRANGERIFVQQMSDGTRDQLFLAFRLASIEQHNMAVEPLPFIADDILVHFDDQRSAATLNLLAEFGRHHQILLFTHHQAVRQLAQPLAEQGLAHILELDRAAFAPA